MCSTSSFQAAELLSPLQLGVGVANGCEAIIHAVRSLLESNDANDTYIVQCDFINAFNEADRLAAYNEILEHFPELAKWTSTCYGSRAALLLGDMIIPSTRGFHQGDPLAPLLFALLLLPVILRLVREVPDLDLNSWLLDDGLIGGLKADVRKAIEIIIEEGARRGLRLSTLYTCPEDPKSRVWCADAEGDDPLNLGIPRISDDGFIHLGSPIGSDSFIERSLSKQVDKVETMLSKLPLLEDAHLEFVALRSCLSIPKVMYSLRTTLPTESTLSVWQRFDNLLRGALGRILGCNLGHQEWAQSQLPLHLGGFNLRSAQNHSSSAFLGSLIKSDDLVRRILHNDGNEVNQGTEPLLDIHPALSHFSHMVGEPSLLTYEQVSHESQKSLSYRVDTHLNEEFTQNLMSERDKARLGSLCLPHVGTWLNVVPNKSLGLHFRSQEFRICLMYRLGMPVFTEEGPCPACSTMFMGIMPFPAAVPGRG